MGKTALVKHYVNGEYPNNHVMTVGDLYEKKIYQNNSRKHSSCHCLRIFDTAGTLRFPAMRKLEIRKADAFILVYAADDTNSFKELKDIREDILYIKEKQSIPTVLVANKTDLPKTKWAVDRTTGLKLAKEWNCGFAEISAKDINNVEQIFQVLFEELKEQEERKLENFSSPSLTNVKETSSPSKNIRNAKRKLFHTLSRMFRPT